MNNDFDSYLRLVENRFDEKASMVTVSWQGPGYHSRIPEGARVHAVVPSLKYALVLLKGSNRALDQRAIDIISKILPLQELDSSLPTYGIWPWLLEEPLSKMSPPDWNWADFCGGILLLVLKDHSGQIPASLKGLIREALGHAAWSIFRRNVLPGYTNICIMGAGIAAATGECLGEPRLVEYGRRRLQSMVRSTEYHESFEEYNSPFYTLVALEELDRILYLVTDSETRRAAEWLHAFGWQMVADHFHPGSGQWAGPHSRSYSDLLTEAAARYLS